MAWYYSFLKCDVIEVHCDVSSESYCMNTLESSLIVHSVNIYFNPIIVYTILCKSQNSVCDNTIASFSLFTSSSDCLYCSNSDWTASATLGIGLGKINKMLTSKWRGIQ